MKHRLKWIVLGLLVALIAGGALRALSARKAQKETLEAQQSSQKIQSAVDLMPADLVPIQALELRQGLAIAGPLKAVNSAVIKARVAGEICPPPRSAVAVNA